MAKPEQDPSKAAVNSSPPLPGADTPKKPLSPAAERALAEAAERRAVRDRAAKPAPEQGGRKEGLDPVRYGDWEVKGLATDF